MENSNNNIRAAVMLSPGRIETQFFPRPDVQAGAVLVEMELSGICGTEHERNLPFPIIPGHE